MSYLVAYLAERHDVVLFTLDQPDMGSFYPLPHAVPSVCLDRLGGSGVRRVVRVLSRPSRIRREVRNRSPDVVLSFMDTMNVTAIIACLGLSVPVVVSERNDPAFNRIGWAKELLRDRLYRFARLVVMQTPRAAHYFPASLSPKLRIIPNPVPLAAALAEPDRPNARGRFRIIAVGRLEKQKAFDELIDAFKRVANEQPKWDLAIIGEGSERPRLEALVERLALTGRVELRGIVKDVSGELTASHLMAFPSHYEGFPNALAEGLAVGLPAVGYNGVSGVEDLIVQERTGIGVDLSGGPTALAGALARLMSDAPLRNALGQAARRHVMRWTPEEILVLWEKALIEASKPTATAGQNMSASLMNGLSTVADRYDMILCDVWGVLHDGVTVHRAACEALRQVP